VLVVVTLEWPKWSIPALKIEMVKIEKLIVLIDPSKNKLSKAKKNSLKFSSDS
jgi:hypothetical protein